MNLNISKNKNIFLSLMLCIEQTVQMDKYKLNLQIKCLQIKCFQIKHFDLILYIYGDEPNEFNYRIV